MLSNKNNFVLIFATLAITSAIYYPGLFGGFHIDDYPNIIHNKLVDIENLTIEEFQQSAWSGNAGPIKRPIAMLSFGINTYFTGKNPLPMKVTNLIIHLSTGLILIFLAKIILSRWKQDGFVSNNVNLLAILIGACWLLHPINLTGVLYIVQRMTSLASLFAVLSMLCYCLLRSQPFTFPRAIILSILIGIFSVLSLYSKEIAVLIPFQILIIEVCVFRFKYSCKLEKFYLSSFYIICVALPLLMLSYYLLNNFSSLEAAYRFREFSLQERVLTQAGIVLWYLKMILIPDISNLGLLLDSFTISKNLFNPPITFVYVSGIFFLLLLGLASIKKYPFIAFGILFFFISHTLESTILNLELAFEHRNYLPSFSIIILFITVLTYLFNSPTKRKFAFTLCTMWAIALAYTTHLRASHWENPLKLAIYDTEHHPNSERAHMVLSETYKTLYVLEKDNQEHKSMLFNFALKHIDKARSLDPRSLSPKVGKLLLLSRNYQGLPKNELEKLYSYLQTENVDASTINTLQRLTKCILNNRCKIDHETYILTMASTLSNRNINPQYKAYLLISYSNFIAKIMKNYNEAEQYIRESIQIFPQAVGHRSNLIDILVAQNKINEARKELLLFKNHDSLNIHQKTISDWDSLLNQTSELELYK